MQKKFFATLLILPTLPLYSCSVSLGDFTINPENLSTYNAGLAGFNSFNRINSWANTDVYLFENLWTNFLYQDRFNQYQGGLLVDEDVQKQLASGAYSEFFEETLDNEDGTYLSGDGKTFTGVFRSGTNLGDDTARVPWVDVSGNLSHPVVETYFNQDTTKTYYTCPEDVMNELVFIFNPYDYDLNSGYLWVDELMSYGEQLLEYISQVAGYGFPTADGSMPWDVDDDGNLLDPYYNSDFDASHNAAHVALTGEAYLQKFALAQYNCAALAKACLDGKYKQWNPETNVLENLRIGENHDQIKIPYPESQTNNVLTLQEYDGVDFADPEECNFVSTGVLTPNEDSNHSTAVADNPWYFQLNFGDNPKPYASELFAGAFTGISPDRLVNYFDTENSGLMYGVETSWQNVLLNGAYAISHYVANRMLEIKVNPNSPLWTNSDEKFGCGNIKNIKIYLKNIQDAAMLRYSFESRDVQDSYIPPTDTVGYDLNIGDLNNPKNKYISWGYSSDGAMVNLVDHCVYSPLYDSASKVTEADPRKLPSFLYAIPSYAAYEEFTINRGASANYYAKSVDNAAGYFPNTPFNASVYNVETDSFATSVANINWLNADEKYEREAVDYLCGENGYFGKIVGKAKSNLGFNEAEKAALDTYLSYFKDTELNKKDFTRFNFFLGLNAWRMHYDETTYSNVFPDEDGFGNNLMDENLLTEYLTAFKKWLTAGFGSECNKNLKVESAKEMVAALQKKVAADLDRLGIGENQRTLIVGSGSSTNLSSGPYTKDMFDSLKVFDTSTTKSPVTYKQAYVKSSDVRTYHKVDALLDGWASDYHDPVNTLNNCIASDGYFPIATCNINSFRRNWLALTNVTPLQQACYKQYMDCFDVVKGYMEIADSQTGELRAQNFAEAETTAIYKYNYCYPSSRQGPTVDGQLSFIKSETRLTNNTTVSFFTLEQTSKLREFKVSTKEEFLRRYIVEYKSGAINEVSADTLNTYLQKEWKEDIWGEQPTFAEFTSEYSDGAGGWLFDDNSQF